jgi:hypothetical protein
MGLACGGGTRVWTAKIVSSTTTATTTTTTTMTMATAPAPATPTTTAVAAEMNEQMMDFNKYKMSSRRGPE